MLSLQRFGAIAGVSSLLGLTAWSQAAVPLRGEGLARGSWSAQVGEELRGSEYHWAPVREEEGVWCAANRSQELQSRLSSDGIEVFPRETSAQDAGTAWKLRLRTKSFGRLLPWERQAPAWPFFSPCSEQEKSQAGAWRSQARGVLCTEGARAELDHGPLIEWFENRENGIEQGWTITSAPAGADPLWIGLELQGELSFRIDEGAHSGVLVDDSGEARLRYGELRAWDATGRALDARLESSPEVVGIQIDDAGALYPLTVDPLLTLV